MTINERATEPTPSIDEQLDAILRDAEAAISQLREALAEQQRLVAQHREIDRLPEHLARTSARWSEIRGFVDELIDELHGRRPEGGNR